MKKKKLLTLEDLVKFCKAQRLFSFSSKDSGYQIAVQVPATFEVKDADSSLLLFANIKAFHTGRNRNRSNVTFDAAEKSLNTFAYKPILAAFHTNEETGEEDFMSHEMEIDDDGNIVYIEQQVGCFTADEPYMEQDSEHEDRQYIYATAAIPREYTHTANIIERKGGTKVSVELIVNEFQYDEEEDELLLSDIEVSGLTLLGTDEDWNQVEEGMEGARLDIADFSKSNNSVFELNENVKKFIQDSIIETLDNINSQRKEENQMNHFEELLEKYEKTVEDIAFAYEGLSDEELDAAFAEAFEKAPETENPESEEGESEGENVDFSVTYKGETKSFSKSLTDVIYALTDLVNATYAEDGGWYAVDVFDSGSAKSKYVIMQDVFSGKAYKQSWNIKDGAYSLKGEREEVFAEWLTASERDQLESMRSNYASVSEELTQVKDKLSKHEAEPDKMSILEGEEYAKIAEIKEFEELKKQENHFDLSVDEVREKADQILLNAAKTGKVEFSVSEPKAPTVSVKPLPMANNTKKRYGSLLSDI